MALRPDEATTEGVRSLRTLLKHSTFNALATQLRCDSRLVRAWGKEEWRPSPRMRERVAEVLGIPSEAWDEALVVQV